MFATFLLVYLALRSVRDARDLRVIQSELTVLMRDTKDLAEERHGLQGEIRTDQRAAKETKRTVEQVSEVVEQAALPGHRGRGAGCRRRSRTVSFSPPLAARAANLGERYSKCASADMRRSRSSSSLCGPIETRRIRRSSQSHTGTSTR
jgi:hypothetical protein